MGVTMYKKKRRIRPKATSFRRTGVRGRIHAILMDFKHHSREELKAELWDELSDFGAIRVHVHLIRKQLPAGWKLIYEYVNEIHGYRIIPTESKTPR